MPRYRIYRMKEAPRQNFRWSSHAAGTAQVKPKDYDPGAEVEGPTPYAVWSTLRDTPDALQVGDLLESETGTLHVCKYVGFDEAVWLLPEIRSGLEQAPAAAGFPGLKD